MVSRTLFAMTRFIQPIDVVSSPFFQLWTYLRNLISRAVTVCNKCKEETEKRRWTLNWT